MIYNVLIGVLILILYLFNLFDEEYFAISIAIIIPVSSGYINDVFKYLFKEKAAGIEDDSHYEQNKTLIHILIGIYCIMLLGIIGYQALKPLATVKFISVLGFLEVAVGIYLNKVFKTIYGL